MSDTYQAMQLVALDAPLVMQDVARAPLGHGQVRVAIGAAGLNFGDLLIVKGTYQEKPVLPATIGMEFAGTIIEVGEGAGPFKTGDRIATYSGMGAFAREAVVDAAHCVAIPDAMSFDDAAAFLVAYGTKRASGFWCWAPRAGSV